MSAMTSTIADDHQRAADRDAVYLGIDGGGTKTSFLLLAGDGRLLARHVSTTSYYLEIGFDALRALLHEGIAQTLRQAGLGRASVRS